MTPNLSCPSSLSVMCAALSLFATSACIADTPGQTTPQPPPAAGAPAAQPAPAAAPAGPSPGTYSVSGLVDVYYGINARAPSPPARLTTSDHRTIRIDNVGRAFDINDREPSFSLGELNISRTAGKGFPLGFTVTLTAGDTARLVHANEPGGSTAWSAIQQAYITYTPHLLKRDVAVDFGVFATPLGTEVIESSTNDEYSRGFVFTYAIPLYNAGLRIAFPITPKLNFLGAVVNGWNNIADDNNAKSFIAQFAWTPCPKFTGSLTFMGGAEGEGAYGSIVPDNAGSIDTNLLSLLGTYTPTAKLKLGAETDYGFASGSVGASHVSGDWIGIAGYARYQITPAAAVAARIEQFEDLPGWGSLAGDGAPGGLRLGAGYARLRSATLTMEYTLGHFVSRLEYRHDHANRNFFDVANGGMSRDQDTVELGEVYKF